MKQVSRGVRNNNPGNIERTGVDKWVGLAAEQSDPRFLTFTSPAFGIRAIAIILMSYQDRHGLKTIEQMISRWAPPGENPTSSYAAFVAERCQLPVDEPVDVREYQVARPMVEAIIAFENGGFAYPRAVIDEGLRRAGIVPGRPTRAREIARTDTVKAGSSATAATAAAGAVATVAPQLWGLDWRVAVAAVIVAAVAAVAAIWIWRSRRD